MNPAITGWASPGRQLNARTGIGTQSDPFECGSKVRVRGNNNGNVEVPLD